MIATKFLSRLFGKQPTRGEAIKRMDLKKIIEIAKST